MKKLTKEDGGFTTLKLNGHNFEIFVTSPKERGMETSTCGETWSVNWRYQYIWDECNFCMCHLVVIPV
jgi:hypothetical protein